MGSIAAVIEANLALRGSSTVAYRLNITASAVVIAWFGWRVIACPSIIVRREGLTVVNRFVRHDVAWSAIRAVEALPDFAILLKDGRRIGVASGSGSVLGDLRGNKHLLGQGGTLEGYLQEFSKAEVGGRVLSSRIDLRILPILALSVVLGLFAWVVQYIP
jgi:hypothetical protein